MQELMVVFQKILGKGPKTDALIYSVTSSNVRFFLAKQQQMINKTEKNISYSARR
jgi:hypothetical protein